MKDSWGKIWLLVLGGAILGLSLSLWRQGTTIREEARETYLHAEAQRLLGCRVYLLNAGLPLDINENGIREYLFSCDSALSAQHVRFVWLEVREKKVSVLLAHSEKGWEVGGAAGPSSGVSWLLDRRKKTFLVVPAGQEEPLQLQWKADKQCIELVEP
ncbi:MAG: hypothetical protein KatS3mg026_1599 [Bacteroidia bacterium]|nr:MAG: hypothetical protein KatS3mg026_1599 [Bacteroidia bacterium]